MLEMQLDYHHFNSCPQSIDTKQATTHMLAPRKGRLCHVISQENVDIKLYFPRNVSNNHMKHVKISTSTVISTSNRSICGDSNLQQKSFQTSMFPQHESMGGWWMITSIFCASNLRDLSKHPKRIMAPMGGIYFQCFPFFHSRSEPKHLPPPKNNMGGWWMMDNVNPGLINP